MGVGVRLVSSIGRIRYSDTFSKTKPVMTMVMAECTTRGKSRRGFPMSPRTKPIYGARVRSV
jgi:hypothetical protein